MLELGQIILCSPYSEHYGVITKIVNSEKLLFRRPEEMWYQITFFKPESQTKFGEQLWHEDDVKTWYKYYLKTQEYLRYSNETRSKQTNLEN